MRYPIAIEPGTDATAFGVVIPDLRGCFSAGDNTLEEAVTGAEEAAAGSMQSRMPVRRFLRRAVWKPSVGTPIALVGHSASLPSIPPCSMTPLSGRTSRCPTAC
jgi:predicted RNase H-like HicB family nuclease